MSPITPSDVRRAQDVARAPVTLGGDSQAFADRQTLAQVAQADQLLVGDLSPEMRAIAALARRVTELEKR